jgi:hypothetical protein
MILPCLPRDRRYQRQPEPRHRGATLLRNYVDGVRMIYFVTALGSTTIVAYVEV